MKRKLLIYFLLEIFIITAFFPIIIFAQTVQSNCIITKVGKPDANVKPQLPPGCAQQNQYTPSEGIIPLENLRCESDGYCYMHDATDGSYESYTCPGRRWGSRLLIEVLSTVAKRWKEKYPQGYLNLGDLNATGHASHRWGRAVDLVATTNGQDMVADFTENFGPYNQIATIELGKMFADTYMVKHIWFNDVTVNSAVLEYANQTGRSKNMWMQPITGHDNHFHLDVSLEPLLPDWTPGC